MRVALFPFLLFLSTAFCHAQIRVEKLVIPAGESYPLIGSDILVADTLIMENASRIVLNRNKTDNFIHAKVIQVGTDCAIVGHGANGADGEKGLAGYTATGPCKDGIPGRPGKNGTNGTDGVNLFIYFGQLTIAGKLSFELSGGNGGDGGKGGNGGGGSPGTRLCPGGNGGAGGDGGDGGNAGNGGTLTLTCNGCGSLRAWMGNKIQVRAYGGNAGLGGEGGLGGLAGLVSAGRTSQDGNQGPKGKEGAGGNPGKNGAIDFEEN
ncbi:MAG: hypothetical protein M9954_00045 [Cyclobacteriaceae bacterium]|nr:hypothetical protein [Cyclobacteriaceae bacterium]MCB9237869.1 hypothetical protein [Flammeovirgaceae bacterium]MCO5270030.1 hypothetical protein [Cyclobacteriaceae bacterium]MCW5902526.1 hypothetical protein [Cyclobacteriaceae bacterium]